MNIINQIFILVCWLNLSSAVKDTYGSSVFARYSACQENKDENTFDFNSKKFIIEPPKINSTDAVNYGNIGILGGLSGTVGALNFAGMGALRVGCNRAHIYVITTEKKFEHIRPDFVMHHYSPSDIKSLLDDLNTMDIVVLGPGLERIQQNLEIVKEVIRMCKKNNKPLILDLSDYFHSEGVIFRELIQYPEPGVIVMINSQEFERIYPFIKMKDGFSDAHISIDFNLLGPNILVYRKGCVDMAIQKYPENSWSYIASKTDSNLKNELKLKRSRGQGSIIAGMTATFFHWLLQDNSEQWKDKDIIQKASVATFVAAKTMKLTNDYTVGEGSRSVLTSDMLEKIPLVLYGNVLREDDENLDI